MSYHIKRQNLMVLACFFSVFGTTACNELRENMESTNSSSLSATTSPTPSIPEEVCDSTLSPFGGGMGSVSEPFLICSVAQLQNVANDLTKNYKLKSDLDLSSVTFSPLGTWATGFSGSFDGDQHTIANWSYESANKTDAAGGGGPIEADNAIKVSSPNAVHIDYAAGFFRTLENGAAVRNLTLTHVNLWGRFYTGALVGYMKSGSKVQNCHVTTDGAAADVTNTSITNGIVIGYNDHPTGYSTGHTGGLVGTADAGTLISQSSFTGNVRGAMHVGGLVGQSYGLISLSQSVGAVMGRDGNSGGLVGAVEDGGSILNSNSSSSVTETSANGGGLVGSARNSVIMDCYHSGSVSGSSGIGGFAGYLEGSRTFISKSFSTGSVSGVVTVGGFVGWAFDGPTIEDSYSIANVFFSNDSGRGAAGFISGLATAGSASLNRVYSAGTVTPSLLALINMGDLVGFSGSGAAITSSYALDSSTSNSFIKSDSGATITSSSSKSAADMKDASTYTGWNFSSVWKIDPAINNGYPTLR